jgi:hypothetical protein
VFFVEGGVIFGGREHKLLSLLKIIMSEIPESPYSSTVDVHASFLDTQ